MGPLGSLSFMTMGKPRFVHVVQSVPAVPACANSLNRAGGHPGPFSGKLDPGGPNWHRNPSVFFKHICGTQRLNWGVKAFSLNSV